MSHYATIVFNSAISGNLRRLKVFLDRRSKEEAAEILSKKVLDTPAIVLTAKYGHIECVRYMIEKGADLSQTGTLNFDGETIEEAPAIWAASAAGHLEIVKLLLGQGASIDQATATNSSALRAACYDGHSHVACPHMYLVGYLINEGADVELSNRHGHTPLMISAYRQQINCVRLLLDNGADVNRRSERGDTALHDAAEAGNVNIVKLLLSRGARILLVLIFWVLRDENGLTAVLSAAAVGHGHVVELLLTQKEAEADAVDALKLIGATMVDKKRDIGAALDYWRRALRVPSQLVELRCDSDDDQKSPAEFSRRRQPWKTDVPKVYEQPYGEIDSIEDLEAIGTDQNALRMQALVMRERILGASHSETHYYLRYRGAIYADVGRYSRCFDLWLHALGLQQRSLPPFSAMTQATLMAFVEMFDYMLSTSTALLHDQELNEKQPTFEYVFAVFRLVVKEMERGLSAGSNDERRHTCADECRERTRARFCVICLHLVSLIGRLGAGRVSEAQEANMMAFLQLVVCLNPIVEGEKTLLHLACSEQNTLMGEPRYSVGNRFPSLYVCERLLYVGADPNAVDHFGDTPLHTVLRCRQLRPSVVNVLLRYNSHVDRRATRSLDQSSPYDLMMAKRMTPRVDFRPWEHQTLACLAARTLLRHNVNYTGILPKELEQFVGYH